MAAALFVVAAARLFAIFNNLLGHLHAHILDAIAKYHLYGPVKAKESMQQALASGPCAKYSCWPFPHPVLPQ